MLVAPGSSLGGARPKASVVGKRGDLWIAKFPSRNDDVDVGAWESVALQLAAAAGITVPETRLEKFGTRNHTLLSKRFDRDAERCRLHFTSALTAVQRPDGDGATAGVSYLELVQFLQRNGASARKDLEQLWRRIVFFMCISNTDDHLRNHGFLSNGNGWWLSPAYDITPNRHGDGLALNVSESDNTQDLDLARSVAAYFQVSDARAKGIIREVTEAVRDWRKIASALKISAAEQARMERAFRLVSG